MFGKLRFRHPVLLAFTIGLSLVASTVQAGKRDDVRAERKLALELARELGEGKAPDVPGLLALLERGRAVEREYAAEEIGRVASRAWDAVNRHGADTEGPPMPWAAGEPLLRHALDDSEIGVRHEALLSLGTLPSREGLIAILKVLDSSDEEGWESGIRAVSSLADLRWVREGAPWETCGDWERAQLALTVLDQPAEVARLVAAYRSAEFARWREELASVLILAGRSGLEALLVLAGEPGPDRELIVRLLEEELEIRWPRLGLGPICCSSFTHVPARKNLQDIVRLRTRRTVRGLLAELFLTERAEQRRLVQLLGLIGDRSATPALLRHLASSEDEEDQMAAIAALGRLHDRRALPALSALLAREDVGWIAAEALAANGPRGLGVLVREASSDDSGRRETALWGLDALDPVDASHLRPLVVHSNREVRADALSALAQLRHPELDRLLVLFLQDPDLELVREAARGFSWSEDPAVREAFVAELENPDPRRRALAARGVGWFGASGSVGTLMRLAADADAGVRAAATTALGGVQHPSLQALLLISLDDPVASVRAAAVSSLGTPLPSVAVPRLLGLLADPDETVRCRAAESLGRSRERRALDPIAALAASAPTEPGRCYWRALRSLEAVDELICLVQHRDPLVRTMAALFVWSDPELRLTAALHAAFIAEDTPRTAHVIAKAIRLQRAELRWRPRRQAP